jgi:hypothetical protein
MEVPIVFLVCFLFPIFCRLSKAGVISRYYTMEPSFDKLSNTNLKSEQHSKSYIECAVMCGQLCCCFGFNPREQKCRLYQSCDPSDMTIDETGWRLFCPDGTSCILVILFLHWHFVIFNKISWIFVWVFKGSLVKTFRIFNFFGLSITEQTSIVETRIWYIKIGIVWILHLIPGSRPLLHGGL